jgi:nitrous oxidase accessory protein NosD
MKTRICLVVLLLFVSALSTHVSGAQAATRYIGSCGTPSYETIQDGVDAALSGETVLVCPGTYTEVVVVDKAITLTGEGATIKPDDTTALLDQSVRRAAIYVTADEATVQGFEIDGTAGTVHYGVYVYNANDVTVAKNTIHDMTNEIADPVSDKAGVGILFFGWGQGIEGATIDRNTIYNTGRHGIFIGGEDSAGHWLLSSGVISRNTVFKSWQGPTDDAGGGIQINGARYCVVGNNNVHHTGQPTAGTFYPGIYLAGTVGGTVWGSNLHQNLYGLVVWVDSSFVVFGTSAPTMPTLAKNNLHGNDVKNLWTIP